MCCPLSVWCLVSWCSCKHWNWCHLLEVRAGLCCWRDSGHCIAGTVLVWSSALWVSWHTPLCNRHEMLLSELGLNLHFQPGHSAVQCAEAGSCCHLGRCKVLWASLLLTVLVPGLELWWLNYWQWMLLKNFVSVIVGTSDWVALYVSVFFKVEATWCIYWSFILFCLWLGEMASFFIATAATSLWYSFVQSSALLRAWNAQGSFEVTKALNQKPQLSITVLNFCQSLLMSASVLSSRVRDLITEKYPRNCCVMSFNPLRVPYPEENLEHPLWQMDFLGTFEQQPVWWA